MIFLVKNWYPGHKLDEVAKIQQKIPQQAPPYIKKWQLFITAGGKKGLKGYGLVYADPEKVEEAGLYISKIMSLFNEVEGHSWKVEILLGMKDALKVQTMQI
jgi:hypothetical protein